MAHVVYGKNPSSQSWFSCSTWSTNNVGGIRWVMHGPHGTHGPHRRWEESTVTREEPIMSRMVHVVDMVQMECRKNHYVMHGPGDRQKKIILPCMVQMVFERSGWSGSRWSPQTSRTLMIALYSVRFSMVLRLICTDNNHYHLYFRRWNMCQWKKLTLADLSCREEPRSHNSRLSLLRTSKYERFHFLCLKSIYKECWKRVIKGFTP